MWSLYNSSPVSFSRRFERSWKHIFPVSSGLFFLCLMAIGILSFSFFSHTWLSLQVSMVFAFIRNDVGLFSLQRHVLSGGGINGEFAQETILPLLDVQRRSCSQSAVNGTDSTMEMTLRNACNFTKLLCSCGFATAAIAVASCACFVFSFWYLKSALSMRDIIAPHAEPFRPLLTRTNGDAGDVSPQSTTASLLLFDVVQDTSVEGQKDSLEGDVQRDVDSNEKKENEARSSLTPYRLLGDHLPDGERTGYLGALTFPLSRLETIDSTLATKTFTLGSVYLNRSFTLLRVTTLLLAAAIVLWVMMWKYAVNYPQSVAMVMGIPTSYLSSSIPVRCKPSAAFYAFVFLFLLTAPMATLGKKWMYRNECWSLSPSIAPSLTGSQGIFGGVGSPHV